MRKLAVTIIILSLSLLTPTTTQAYGEELVMPWGFYRRLAQCETGSDVNHSTKNYTSMFGIARGTWQRWSNRSSAKGLNSLQQARVVDNIAWDGHWTGNHYKHPVGPWGWAVVKSNCMGLKDLVCKSKHPKVQRWKYRC
jgi:hypothetical protein